MFVYDFIQVDMPFEAVSAALHKGGDSWLSHVATVSYLQSARRARRAGLGDPDGGDAGSVSVVTGQSFVREHLVTLPFHWEATGIAGTCPVLEGELEISELHDGTTHIGLMGRYEPAPGALARMLDRIVLHHATEGAVRSFLHELVSELTARVPAA